MQTEEIKKLAGEEKWAEAFELAAQPLHERLYERQSFDVLEEFSAVERAIIALDYVNTQVSGGGFIQFIQNGYIPLLVPLIESLQELQIAQDLVQALDDVLKVYVLNQEELDKETSVEAFARLYNEFSEFDVLETRYNESYPEAEKALLLIITAPA